MHALHGAVDDLNLAVASLDDRVHEPLPHSGLGPALEANVAGRRGPMALRRERAQDPDDAVQDPPMVSRRTPRGLLGKSGSLADRSKSVRSQRRFRPPLFGSLNHIYAHLGAPFMGASPNKIRNLRFRGGLRLVRCSQHQVQRCACVALG